jgi:hypothetical protein
MSNQSIKINGVKQFWEIRILTISVYQVFGLTGQGWGIVDWGDGTVTNTFLSDDIDQINNTHIYASPGTYTIKLQGFYWVFFEYNQPNMVISTSVIPTSDSLVTFQNTFKNCTFLNSIPRNLFANVPHVTNFFGCFAGCTSLTSVPADLFSANLKANDFRGCFNGVTLTTASYSNLLINLASTASERPNGDQGNDGPLTFHGGNSKYNLAGQAARNILLAKGWQISDGGLQT